jgi:2-oxoglutarate ferredoxin oxidoreductase subunit gamma
MEIPDLEKKIIIAGSGGQGILFLGKVLAFTSMIEKKEVTWFPSYGAEIRGGTANCTVIISDTMIASPVVITPDILIAMNKVSLDKFHPRLKKGGLLFFDSSLMKKTVFRDDIVPIAIPAIHIANAAGNTKSANMVMLGALIEVTHMLKKSSFLELFSKPSALIEKETARVNKFSFLKGIKYIENKKINNI